MAAFTSAYLGEVQHPKNVLREYLSAFGNKCQADILSWLDGWTKTKRSQGKSDWVRVVTDDLAENLGYCKATICKHLNQLVEKGVLVRDWAKLFPCDRAYKYQIIESELAKHIAESGSKDRVGRPPTPRHASCSNGTATHTLPGRGTHPRQVCLTLRDRGSAPPDCLGNPCTALARLFKIEKNQSIDEKKVVDRESKPSPSTEQKQPTTDINSNSSLVKTQQQPTAVDEQKTFEELQMMGVKPNCTVRSTIRLYWHNVKDASAHLWQRLSSGEVFRCPEAVFVKACIEGAKPEIANLASPLNASCSTWGNPKTALAPPHPSPLQLEHLQRLGRLLYQGDLVCVVVGNEAVPWNVLLEENNDQQ